MADEGSASSDSGSVTVTRIERASHQLIVENYSLRKGLGVNVSIDSDYFMVGGYNWEIRFFPGGKTDDMYNQGYTSLFMALRSEVSNPVPCIFDIHLLDQSGKGKHIGLSFFNRFPPRITYATFGLTHGIRALIKRDSLEPPSDYLKDDCLKFNCTVGVLTYHIQNLPLNKVPEPNMRKDLETLLERERGKKADVFFKVDGETFQAHKSILATQSTVFCSHLLEAHQPHQEIVIPDMEPRIFEALLWFIYTTTLLEEEQAALSDSSQFIESFMGKMLAATDQFGLKRLKEIYELRILERVYVESVPYLLHLSDRCHATQLKEACIRFASENRAAVLESNGVGYLKAACPLLFLEFAGYTEKPSTNRERELDLCTKFVSAVKESFGGMFSPYAYKKLKEV